jgi:outer membrane immunogenic protein
MSLRGLSSALLASIVALAGTAALAADPTMLKGSQMDLPPPPDLEQAARPIHWGGFYIGGFGGLTQSRFSTDKSVGELANLTLTGSTAIADYNPPALVAARPRTDSGPSFGGMAGYNFMYDQLMMGVELDWTKLDQKTSVTTFQGRAVNGTGLTIASRQDGSISHYATARIRLGWAMDNFMPYVTAGVAAGQFDTNVSVTSDWLISNGATPPVFTSALGYPQTLGGAKKGTWGFGMSLGGGVDVALTENIFLRGEYLYTRFNDVNGITVGLNTARVAAGVKF